MFSGIMTDLMASWELQGHRKQQRGHCTMHTSIILTVHFDLLWACGEYMAHGGTL